MESNFGLRSYNKNISIFAFMVYCEKDINPSLYNRVSIKITRPL